MSVGDSRKWHRKRSRSEKGWYTNPGEFPKPSKLATALENKVKLWWTKWQWVFAALAVIVGILGGLSALLRGH